jgi:sodium/potassium-transporting ATPase subunit beta
MPSAEVTSGFVLGATAFRPEDQTLKKFLWNDGKFLGRGAKSWGLIIIFYIIYYACLALFWGAMLLVFFTTLEENSPKWKVDYSIIGTNPGLGYRPMPPHDYIESTLIWFKLGGKDSEWKAWSDRVQDFLELYDKKHKAESRAIETCKDDQEFANDEKYCDFDISLLGDWCTKENNFGYKHGKPCVLIKLNKIYDWKPILYTTAGDFPEDLNRTLPKDVLERLDTSSKAYSEGSGKVGENKDMFNVWLTCEGENPADKENIGQITYFPGPYFKSFYYPYQNAPGYLQPLVAVQFHGPENGVLINIECRAYAKNIEHDRSERIGSVHFELLMD